MHNVMFYTRPTSDYPQLVEIIHAEQGNALDLYFEENPFKHLESLTPEQLGWVLWHAVQSNNERLVKIVLLSCNEEDATVVINYKFALHEAIKKQNYNIVLSILEKNHSEAVLGALSFDKRTPLSQAFIWSNSIASLLSRYELSPDIISYVKSFHFSNNDLRELRDIYDKKIATIHASLHLQHWQQLENELSRCKKDTSWEFHYLACFKDCNIALENEAQIIATQGYHGAFKQRYLHVLSQLKEYSHLFKKVGSFLRNDKGCIFAIMPDNYYVLSFIGKKAKKNKEIAMIAVKHGGDICYFDKSLQQDKELLKIYMDRSYWKWLHQRMSDSDPLLAEQESRQQIILETLKRLNQSNNAELLSFLSVLDSEYANKGELFIEAVKYNPYAVHFIGPALQENLDFIKKIVAFDHKALPFFIKNSRYFAKLRFASFKSAKHKYSYDADYETSREIILTALAGSCLANWSDCRELMYDSEFVQIKKIESTADRIIVCEEAISKIQEKRSNQSNQFCCTMM